MEPKKIILCPNPDRDTGMKATKSAIAILRDMGFQTVVCSPFRDPKTDAFGDLPSKPLLPELKGADLVITLGGDGTILHLAKLAALHKIPMLGINMGGLGFLAELEVGSLNALRGLKSWDFPIEERMMLDVSVLRDGKQIYTNMGLNDAVIREGPISHVIHLKVFSDGKHLADIAGDGAIIATPTGSTAYSLSAGGPVVEPVAQILTLTPICTHNMRFSSYVLSPDHTLTVSFERNGRKPIFLFVDESRAFPLHSNDIVQIRRSRYLTRLAHLSEKSFCEVFARKRGVASTQATISRDIKQLHLVKEPTGHGTYKYAVSSSRARLNIADKLRTIFHESITSVDCAQNIVVFKTLAGLAGGACEALDHMDVNGMVGTLAGENTVFVVMKDNACAETFCQEIREML